jgi:AraC-like DNA-binding protein
LNPKRSLALGLRGIGAIAAHMGFTSRSHFARRYEQHYNELPQQTLIQGWTDDKETLSNKFK